MVISPLPLIFPPALFAHLHDQEDQNLINTRVFSINELGENDFVKFQLISITSGNVFFSHGMHEQNLLWKTDSNFAIILLKIYIIIQVLHF